MQKKHNDLAKLIARIFLVCIAVAFFASTIFIFINANHHCTGNICRTCEQISLCIDMFSRLSACIIGVLVACSIKKLTTLNAVCFMNCTNQTVYTLVKLKVRMNN